MKPVFTTTFRFKAKMFVQGCSRGLKACQPRASLKPRYSLGRSYSVFSSLNNGRQTSSPVNSIPVARLVLPAYSFGSKLRFMFRETKGTVYTRAAPYTTDTGSPKNTTIRDDIHPYLFYHLFDDGEVLKPTFSLSFLEKRPQNVRSKTVIGWLPAVSSGEAEAGGSGLEDFEPNHEFLPILHKVVKGGLLEDEMWRNYAIQTQSGWMHVFDQRNIPMPGRNPDPDDILASVRVEDGRMLIDTYEPMPSYRLCTADGVCQLTDLLVDRLRKTLERIAEEERQNH